MKKIFISHEEEFNSNSLAIFVNLWMLLYFAASRLICKVVGQILSYISNKQNSSGELTHREKRTTAMPACYQRVWFVECELTVISSEYLLNRRAINQQHSIDLKHYLMTRVSSTFFLSYRYWFCLKYLKSLAVQKSNRISFIIFIYNLCNESMFAVFR